MALDGAAIASPGALAVRAVKESDASIPGCIEVDQMQLFTAMRVVAHIARPTIIRMHLVQVFPVLAVIGIRVRISTGGIGLVPMALEAQPITGDAGIATGRRDVIGLPAITSEDMQHGRTVRAAPLRGGVGIAVTVDAVHDAILRPAGHETSGRNVLTAALGHYWVETGVVDPEGQVRPAYRELGYYHLFALPRQYHERTA